MNLLAAAIGIAMLRWAASPPDTRHMYGHEKAEYFSAGVEGTLILVAACAIAFAAVQRLFDQQALDEVGIGAAFSAVASLVNLAVGLLLVREERRQRLITVEADGRHLLTDVWTSAGVIAAVIAVALTSWWWLDPVIALVVALNIVVATGLSLLRRAGGGLMDRALPMAQQEKLGQALAPYRDDGIAFHAIRTRQAGRRSFVSLHVLVPGRLDGPARARGARAHRARHQFGAARRQRDNASRAGRGPGVAARHRAGSVVGLTPRALLTTAGSC